MRNYRTVLEAKRSEIAASLGNRDDIAIQKSPDAIDEVQFAAERELAIRNLDRESSLLRNVKAALAAAFCIRCQEAADRHELEEGETLEDFLANAA